MLVSSLYNYVRNLARGARVDLDGLERSGAVFRGGAAPLQWVVGSAQAFEAPAPPPSRAPPLPTGGFPHFPPGALRRLSEDLRAWLLRRPWPHEAVLSRSGVAPFLGTLAGTRAYPCAPSTSHVRAAVASHGVDAHLAWESHRERNNGALVVRAMPRDGDAALDSSGYAASLGSGSPPVHSSSGAHLAGFGSSSSLGSFGDFGSAGTLQRTWSGASLARTSGASLASLGSFPSSGSLSGDPAALAARDAASHQLVDDLYDWLARQRRREVKCADLVPFYAQFPQYRKGGGQGSGIKHAILRFGAGRLMWIEAGAPVAHAVPAGAAGGLAGGDARIALLGPGAAPRYARAVAASPDAEAQRKLAGAQKRLHVAVHDYELVHRGAALPLGEVAGAYRRVHGHDLDDAAALGCRDLRHVLETAGKLRVVGDAVRCRTPPAELGFVEDLRLYVADRAAARPEGISFAELKDEVKAFGRARHTSVRFLRGGILGVVNNVLVPEVVTQLEAGGPFFATRLLRFPPGRSFLPAPPVVTDDGGDDDDDDGYAYDTDLVAACLDSVLEF